MAVAALRPPHSATDATLAIEGTHLGSRRFALCANLVCALCATLVNEGSGAVLATLNTFSTGRELPLTADRPILRGMLQATRATEKVVVTGGAGFIGSHLVERLLEVPHLNVLVFDNLSTGRLSNLAACQAHPRYALTVGDVCDLAAVDAAVHGATALYHLAGRGGNAEADLDSVCMTNVVGTLNVLRAATRNGTRRVVFASSRAVYGEPMGLPVEEDHPLFAVDIYGASKTAGEAFCRAFRREYGLHTIILRLAEVYGPRDAGNVIPPWLARAQAGHDLDVYGGSEIVDLLWVGHTVEALVRAGTIDDPVPPINVGSGTGTKFVDVARRIMHLTNGRSHVKVLPPQRPAGVSRFVADVERMRQLLRVEPPLDPLCHLSSLYQASPARARAAGAIALRGSVSQLSGRF